MIMPKLTKSVILKVSVEPALDKEIKSIALQNDLSQAETIRQAINKGLEKFFVDSQGEFLKDKIKEVISEAMDENINKLTQALEKRLVAILMQNTNYTLQSHSLIDRLLRLEIGFNADKIKSLSDDNIQKLIKANMEIFETESKGFMNGVYEKSRKKNIKEKEEEKDS
jgi:hypothetical protein